MGGGHLSRPDFGMPQPDPDHPLTEFYLLLQHGLTRRAFSTCLRSMPASRHRPGASMPTRPPGASPSAKRRTRVLFCSLLPGTSSCFTAACMWSRMAPRRPAAHRGVFPRCLRGAAAASLCLGGPAAAPAGCPGRSDPAIDPAGCGGHRHRLCRPCPPPVPDHPAEALAGPPQSRSVSCGENCPFPKAISLMQ